MNSQNSLQPQMPDPAEFFRGLFEFTINFAREYAAIVRQWPEFRARTLETGIASHALLETLERCGSDQWSPKLLNASGTQYHMIRKLTRSEQDDLLENGVEVLEESGDTRRIPFADLTPQQAKQAIGRSLAAQRTYLNSLKPKPIKPDKVQIVKGGVIFHGFQISKLQMLTWLEQMK